MKRAFAMALVKALRSGEYTQTEGKLCDAVAGSYCCLGVACELDGIKKRVVESEVIKGKLRTYYGKESTTDLPSAVMKRHGIYHKMGRRRNGEDIVIWGNRFNDLASANDAGIPFSAIADYIEANYKDL